MVVWRFWRGDQCVCVCVSVYIYIYIIACMCYLMRMEKVVGWFGSPFFHFSTLLSGGMLFSQLYISFGFNGIILEM